MTPRDLTKIQEDAIKAGEHRTAALATLDLARAAARGPRIFTPADLIAEAQVYATLALVDAFTEDPALTETAPATDQPPALTEYTSLWQPVTADTKWEPGDRACQVPYDDGPTAHIVKAAGDSFGNTVLQVRWIHRHQTDDLDDIPTEVLHIEKAELPTWRRLPKATP